MSKLTLAINLAAIIAAFGLGVWLTGDHYKAKLAQKDTEIASIREQVSEAMRTAQLDAEKTRRDIEAAWSKKLGTAQTQSEKDLQNAEAKYRSAIASNRRLYVRAEATDNHNGAVDVPSDSAATSRRAVHALLQLPRSTSRNLESYAFDAQRTAIALAACQAAWPGAN